MPLPGKPPLVLFEDDHLLAIDKPAGINTHKPDRYAQDGIHEWLQKQHPDWRRLSILHRLDKETSGAMVFGKTPLANRSITEQFTAGTLRKTYLFLTAGVPSQATTTITAPIEGKPARTVFRVRESRGALKLVEAEPSTGRTHQVRIHAMQAGLPVCGDREHGAAACGFPRLMLHAWRLELRHPKAGSPLRLEAPFSNVAFSCDDRFIEMTHSRAAFLCAREVRELLFDPRTTDCYRLISPGADGLGDVAADRFGGIVVVRCSPDRLSELEPLLSDFYERVVPVATRAPAIRMPNSGRASPSCLAQENGLRFLIRTDQGFSPGLFLDQRENRRRLREFAAGKEVLNCFAYTCAFSVAAAAGGGRTTSVDLSKSYLEWGRENFRVNGLDPAGHDFLYGDVFDWLKRFEKRGRQWDIVMLDPPTFGTTKKGRVFRAAKDYLELARLAARLVRTGGTLFCSTNQRSISPESFVETIQRALRMEKREWQAIHFETQPPDFRVAEGEQPYLKTFWIGL